jgi:hypothetical protein
VKIKTINNGNYLNVCKTLYNASYNIKIIYDDDRIIFRAEPEKLLWGQD